MIFSVGGIIVEVAFFLLPAHPIKRFSPRCRSKKGSHVTLPHLRTANKFSEHTNNGERYQKELNMSTLEESCKRGPDKKARIVKEN
jgi:hypothetical protein